PVLPVPLAAAGGGDPEDDSGAPGTWSHEPQPGDTTIAIDPVLGRVAFADAPDAGETRLATFHYGSALATGGGGYERATSLETAENVVTVQGGGAPGPSLASLAARPQPPIPHRHPHH